MDANVDGDKSAIDGTDVNIEEHERRRRDLVQLKASQSDLASAIARHIDWLLEQHELDGSPLSIEEASARARAPGVHEPGVNPLSGIFEAEQASWADLASLLEHEPERGQQLWQQIKGAARFELSTGIRAADALEPRIYGSSPFRRAQFLALLDGLRDDLQPTGALEDLMVQRMASALEQCFFWQQEAVNRAERDAWQGERDRRRTLDSMRPAERERYQMDHGWLPPRVSDADAINQAATLAERYERAFLRLVRAFRDHRRVVGNLVVAGGQVNIAGGNQQVNGNPPTDRHTR